MPKVKNVLPCEGCQCDTVVEPVSRFLRMLRQGERPRCASCRRMLRQGRDTVFKVQGTQRDPSLGLSRKQGKRAKHKNRIDSMPLDMCGGLSLAPIDIDEDE